MDFLLEDLDSRKRELKEYLSLIEFLDSSTEIKDEKRNNFEPTPLLKKTIKGTIYLILYNLVESTFRATILAIHDEIKSSNSRFEDLRNELQEKILLRTKKDDISIKDLQRDLSINVSLNFHTATLNSKSLFSGNIDRDKIKSIAKIYGFSHETEYSETSHGEQLDVVKRHRNDLAHGNKTFENVGSEKTTQELQEFTDKVLAYVYAISDNVSDYLEQKNYLRD